MNAELKIEFPKLLLTPADLVGKALRTTRLEWRALLTLLWVPTLINNLAEEPANWITSYWKTEANLLMLIGMAVIGVLVSVISRVFVAVRTFALLLMLQRPGNRESAVAAARRQLGTVIVVTLPVILADLAFYLILIGVSFFFDFAYMEAADAGTETAKALVALVVYLSLFGLFIPYFMFCFCNASFAAIVVSERFSIRKSMSRFWYFVTRSPGYLFSCLLVSGVTYILLGYVYIGLSMILSPGGFFVGPSKDLVKIVWGLISGVLFSPLAVFWFASTTILGALLNDQLRMRLDAPDLSKMIDELRTNAS